MNERDHGGEVGVGKRLPNERVRNNEFDGRLTSDAIATRRPATVEASARRMVPEFLRHRITYTTAHRGGQAVLSFLEKNVQQMP